MAQQLPIDARASRTGTRRPLLVFSDDWGRHPSSCQHLVSHLLADREVLWVNTIGTRPPRLDLRTAHRVVEKLRHWMGPAGAHTAPLIGPTTPASSPSIVSPRMWPSFASDASRRLNRHLLAKALTPDILRMPELPTVITTLPITADLVDVLPAAAWVYYCVDDFSVWPDYDGATMQVMERELVPRMDLTIAASDALADGLRTLGASAKVLTHGVDTTAWRPLADTSTPVEFENLEPPFVVFWGVVDRRMDLEWVSALSRSMQRGSIVMFGPEENADPSLRTMPRVALRPPVAFHRLPAIAAAAGALVMPYLDAPVTRAMQPLKLKEYLATGKPAVVRRLPSTEVWADACDVCDSAPQFAAAVIARLEGGLPSDQLPARTRLEAESWAAKAGALSEWIDNIEIADRARPRALTG
jgi:glycosyltransferase involved in cell wall biosynthesis